MLQDRDEIIAQLRAENERLKDALDRDSCTACLRRAKQAEAEIKRLKADLALEKDVSDERLGRAVQAEAEIERLKADYAEEKAEVLRLNSELSGFVEEYRAEIERLKEYEKSAREWLLVANTQQDRAVLAEAEIERLNAENQRLLDWPDCEECDVPMLKRTLPGQEPVYFCAVCEAEAKLEEAKEFGAEMMLSQMVKAVESGGRFSDERANDFVDAKRCQNSTLSKK